MKRPLAIVGLTDRILKGILVTGFQNDADIEKALEEQRESIEGTIARALPELIESMARQPIDTNEPRIDMGGVRIPHLMPATQLDFVPAMNLRGCEEGSKDHRPRAGSVWRHHTSGALYEVRGISNRKGDKEKYPTTVEYKGRHDAEPYSGRLDDWHRRMTFVGMAEQISNCLLPDEDSPRWVESAAISTGAHFGIFVRDDAQYIVVGNPSSDGEVAACRIEPFAANERKRGKSLPKSEAPRWDAEGGASALNAKLGAIYLPPQGPVKQCLTIIRDYLLHAPGKANRLEAWAKLNAILGED